jgi:hypothetical protein
VTIIASITDRSMNLGRQATPSTNLDGSPPMTEGVHLCQPAAKVSRTIVSHLVTDIPGLRA